MEHKHWSMQWVRWAHSAVDYLAAVVGVSRMGGAVVQGKGTVCVGVERETPCTELGGVHVALVCAF